jgi:dihydropteroate synthase
MDFAIRIHRYDTLTVTVSDLSPGEAALLREACASSEVPSGPGFGFPRPAALFITGTSAQIRQFCAFLRSDDRLPMYLPAQIESRLDNYRRSQYPLALKGQVLNLGARTHVMGVLNITPDSFSDGGQFAVHGAAMDHARAMAAQGADIIDIGGESTRPGAEPMSEEEELRRILPVIERVARELTVPVSVDTYKAGVARKALAAGASIVNDISGLRFSSDMARVVADHDAAVVLMHIKGTPRDMQTNPVYEDVVGEIMDYLEESAAIALQAGVGKDRILVDPGIGFGKTVQHNLEIIDRLEEFRTLGFPVVLGTSRKRFIGTVLNIQEPKDRIEGTAATVALAIQRGAHIVRVHDVGPMTQVARMTDAIVRSSTK